MSANEIVCYEPPLIEVFDIDVEGTLCMSGYGYDSDDSEL